MRVCVSPCSCIRMYTLPSHHFSIRKEKVNLYYDLVQCSSRHKVNKLWHKLYWNKHDSSWFQILEKGEYAKIKRSFIIEWRQRELSAFVNATKIPFNLILLRDFSEISVKIIQLILLFIPTSLVISESPMGLGNFSSVGITLRSIIKYILEETLLFHCLSCYKFGVTGIGCIALIFSFSSQIWPLTIFSCPWVWHIPGAGRHRAAMAGSQTEPYRKADWHELNN